MRGEGGKCSPLFLLKKLFALLILICYYFNMDSERFVVDLNLVAEAEKYQEGDVHDVTNLIICYQDAANIENRILQGGKRYTPTDFGHQFDWAELLLRRFVAHKRLGEVITIRQLRKESPYKRKEIEGFEELTK